MAEPVTDDAVIRWGILGAGGIAGKFAADLIRTPGNALAAVGARQQSRAADFAARHGAPRAYGSYRELVEDPDLDVVYIATTHPGHHEQALMAIAAGKAVLIEKPVCLNAADTREVFGAAAAAGVFAMEAMWMRTNPLIRKAQELVAGSAIGELVSVRAELGLGRPFDAAHRLYDLANGGGALLDLGIYPVTFGWIFLGRPQSVALTGALAPTGSDATVAMQWSYPDGRDAQLWCSAPVKAPFRALVVGTEGWIRTEGRFYRPSALTVMTGGLESRIDDPLGAETNGYGPEIAEVSRCLRAGETESPLVPAADTIAIMELLDDARAHLGVRYTGE
ncbi:MAG TPA: Gfo/Idh/MocA family oxidoreductase [Jatrophihabitans sp.]|jgi:predicted dehydrogenase|uniref:Gfo/Idh/MocA family protein n=1 Tax=Jatrophihabitans sp. TaxID=1932789 RepID=UPI002F10E60C